MPKINFTDPQGRSLEVDSPDGSIPSEQELDQMFEMKYGSIAQPQQEQTSFQDSSDFGQSLMQETESILSKEQGVDIGLFDNLMMGLAPNDASRMRYLSERHQGSNVSQDEKGNILVNGDRINPAGFDFGDILRNAGYALPVGGQILGGLMGGTAGSMVPGAGTAAGVATGGIGGSMVGESVRLGLGKAFGIDPTLLEASGSLAKEGLLATGGEVASAGIGAGARAFARTSAGQYLRNFWKETSGKLGKGMTKQLAKFVGGIDDDAVEIAAKNNYQNLDAEYFRPDKTLDIAKNTIFGTSKVPEFEVSTITPNGIAKGTELIAKSINKVNDKSFDTLIKQLTGLSDEAIDTLKTVDVSKVINPDNLSRSKPVRLSNAILNKASSHLNTIGDELGRAEALAIKSNRGNPFATDDIALSLDRAIKESGLLGRHKMAEGFKFAQPIDVTGKKQLLQLRSLFGQELTKSEIVKRFGKEALDKYEDRVFFYGQKVGNQILEGINVKNASILRKRMDSVADDIFENANIPPSLKRIAYDAVNKFRERYHSLLGIEDVSSRYSSFKNLLSEARIDKDSVTSELINKVNRFRSMNTAIQDSIDNVLAQVPGGKSIIDEIKFLQVGNELMKVDPLKSLKGFEGMLNHQDILKLGKTNTAEQFLVQADSVFKTSKNPELARRKYFDDAQLALSAKKFVEGSPNLLRVGAVRSLMGLGAAGAMIGGPVGAGIGGAASLTLSNPQNIAKVLRKLGEKELAKGQQKQQAKQGINILSRLVPTATSGMLRQSSREDKKLSGQQKSK